MAVEVGVFDNVLAILEDVLAKPDRFLSYQEELADNLKTLTKELYDYAKNNELPTTVKSNSLPELIVDHFDDEQIWQQLALQNETCRNQLFHDISRVRNAFNNNNNNKAKPSSAHIDIANDDEEEEEEREEEEENEEVSDEEEIEDDIQEDVDEDDNDDALNNLEFSAESKLLDDEDEDAMSDISLEMEKALDKRIAMNDEIGVMDDSEEDDDDDDVEDEEDDDNSGVEAEIGSEGESKEKRANSGMKWSSRTSIVDDNFFKLAQLQAFLDAEDAKESLKQRRENRNSSANDDEDEEMIDMFQDIQSSDDEEKSKSCRKMKYSDFFDPIEAADKVKKVSFKLQKDLTSMDESESENELDDESLEKKSKKIKLSSGTEQKSPFEIRQEKLKQRIRELEEGSLAEKPWQLLGEAASNIRPENSLLEEHLQFDHMTRPAPTITVESTQKLENIIKQRIKDQAWDDVERKIKPKDDPYEYRKQVVLDQEKSKLSLAEVYEQEYIKQQTGKSDVEEEPKEHQDIKKEMKLLFDKLDALSNFCFVPKQPIPEVRIVNNLPAIAVEEVAPVSITEAALLAPEEIKNKAKGEVKGKTERSETDRHHERRKKKSFQRAKYRKKEDREKLAKKQNDSTDRLSKEIKGDKSDKTDLKKSKASTKLTSSKDFFSKLQGEVQKSNFNKTFKLKHKKARTYTSSNHLKL